MVEPKFCWSCGHPVQPGYRFCEACGAELESIRDDPEQSPILEESNISSKNVISKPPSNLDHIIPGSLFDPQREFYVLHEKYWNWGSGDILDEKGVIIGRMQRIFLSLRARIVLTEVNGTLAAQIHRKLIAIRPTYDLKDAQGVLIGRLRKALLHVIHPKIWLEDAMGNKILEARGSFLRYDFKIYDMYGKLVAEISMLDRWKEFFLGGSILDFSDRYAIHVLDKSVDRRLIIGFCLAIDNTMHDSPQGGFWGIGPFRVTTPHRHYPRTRGPQGPWR